MQMLVIVDPSGAVVAACRRTPERGLQASIRPFEQSHRLHQLDVPPALEQVPLHELVKRFHIGSDGRPNLRH
jgi:hypothetical protein